MMLPWFIWKEIIEYAVEDNRQLCLVDKHWFEIGIGRTLFLNTEDFKLYQKIPYWYKYVEDLSFYENKDLNWDFLTECRRLKSAWFRPSFLTGKELEKIKELIWNSRIYSVGFEFEGEEELNNIFEVLKGISKQLKNLSISDYQRNVPHDKLFSLDFCKLESLRVTKDEGTIPFHLIYQNMPVVQDLTFYIKRINILPISTDLFIFSNLKTLILNNTSDNYGEDEDDQDINNFMDIFKYSYPNLISLEISKVLYNDSLKLITQSMPKLQRLELNIFCSDDSIDVIFPSQTMNHLEKVKFELDGFKGTFKLDLTNTPKLLKLRTTPELDLINSNENNEPVLQYFKFKEGYNPLSQVIYNQLQNLNEVKVEIYEDYEDDDLIPIFKFCERITKLTIDGLQRKLKVKRLPNGPFKTKHLKLRGCYYINRDLLKFLATKFQLISLYLKVSGPVKRNLKSEIFPFLKDLNLNVDECYDDDYLERKIRYSRTDSDYFDSPFSDDSVEEFY